MTLLKSEILCFRESKTKYAEQFKASYNIS